MTESENEFDQYEKGEEEYNLHFEMGISWPDIADSLGGDRNLGQLYRGRARRYAERNELPTTGVLTTVPTTAGEAVTREDAENELILTSKGKGLIRTLDQLIEVCEVDLNEWVVTRQICNAWSVGYKDATHNLDYGQNIQVKGWFAKQRPEAIEPIVQPVQYSGVAYDVPPPLLSSSKRSLLISDLHFGMSKDPDNAKLTTFHDRRALSIILQYIAYAGIDEVIILGDILDLAEWSIKFTRSEDMRQTTQPALLEAHWFLHQLRSLWPKMPIVCLQGNHDTRIQRAVEAKLPEAYRLSKASMEYVKMPVLSLPYLLGCAELGVTWIDDYPDNEHWLGNLKVEHGDIVRTPSGATVQAMLNNAKVTYNVAFGHAHRRERAARVIWGPHGRVEIEAITAGCLCKVTGEVPAQKKKLNWAQGLLQVDSVPLGPYDARILKIDNGAMYADGLQYIGEDYVDELQDVFPQFNW